MIASRSSPKRRARLRRSAPIGLSVCGVDVKRAGARCDVHAVVDNNWRRNELIRAWKRRSPRRRELRHILETELRFERVVSGVFGAEAERWPTASRRENRDHHEQSDIARPRANARWH